MGIHEDEVDSLPGAAVEACMNCRHSYERLAGEYICQWREPLPATLEAILYDTRWHPQPVDADHVCREFEE
jgi:hypothetical protein